MEVTFTHCAGLDVHKKTVVACCITPGLKGEKQTEIRTFGTMTVDLLALSDWLTSKQITHVAMESTGEFWKPIYNLLEGNFELLVVNAKHIKNVPGRKTDVKDAEWIAELLRHGLIRGSFIPPQAQRDLRDLTRQRTNLVQDRATVVNRLQKVLEWANIKLSSVATDVTGVSARAMLEAIVQDQVDPAALSELARGRLRKKRDALEQALTGVVRDHHRFMIAQHLTLVSANYLRKAGRTQ
jgi:transposase